MIDFSHVINVLDSGALSTRRDEESYAFFYELTTVQMLARPGDPVSWKMTARIEGKPNPGFEQYLVPILADGQVVGGQVVMEDYQDEGIRGKGIPEQLLLKWVEHFQLPLFSSVPAVGQEHAMIYSAEGRVPEATKVWERLELLAANSADVNVKTYPRIKLFVLYPADQNPAMFHILKINYTIPSL